MKTNLNKFMSGLVKLTQKYKITLEPDYDSKFRAINIVELKDEDAKEGVYSWLTKDNDTSVNEYGDRILGRNLLWESDSAEIEIEEE